MPTVLNIGPYRVFFVSLDRGEPPHVHVQREGRAAKFWIDPIVLAKVGGFKPLELSKIAALIKANQKKLLERWYEFFSH
ncbi:MAG: DUF4160 domain-containing protein [Candidatus Hydrogenedentes bacterium]|nr:DUF4160 domain-containing protein [Candidatus Hydrogenedentota bacterium]